MKHYSAATLQRIVAEPLRDEPDMLALLLAHVDREGKPALARRLGIRQPELTRVLRGLMPMPAAVVAKLGYRRITRFERIS